MRLEPSDGGGEDNTPPVIIHMTVVLDSGSAEMIFKAMEILSRTSVGLALEGVSTDINIFQPQQMDYVIDVETDDND